MRSAKEHKSQQSCVSNNVTSLRRVLQYIKKDQLKYLVKEGSPRTYLVDNKYVKLWEKDSGKKAQAMLQNWQAADNALIRIPRYGTNQFEDCKSESYFWSNKCKGDKFFQMSKDGHEGNLKYWLSCGHEDWYLRRLSIMFKNFTFGDPQGFYESVPNGILEFIDINKNNNSSVMPKIANYIDTQVLKSTQEANL